MTTIYIPGLGGTKITNVQRSFVRAANIFRRSNNKLHFFDTKWQTPESYVDKYSRLLQFDDSIRGPKRVWAISAGASLAVRLCTERPYDQLHLVCGKVRGSLSIQDHYRELAPAFVESVEQSERLADTLEVETTCYIPKNNADSVIRSEDMQTMNATIQDLPPLRHSRAIGYALFRHLYKV